MTKTIKGNLELDNDTSYDESIVVEGHITCKVGLRFDLKVAGDISAWDISAWDISAGDISAGNISARDISARDISAWDISAGNISAWDISAWDISARDISAWDISASKNLNAAFILCENIKVKGKCVAKKILTKRSSYERKEVKLEADK